MTNDTVLRSTTFVNTHVKFHLYWNPLIDTKSIAQIANGIEWEHVNALHDAYVRLGTLEQPVFCENVVYGFYTSLSKSLSRFVPHEFRVFRDFPNQMFSFCLFYVMKFIIKAIWLRKVRIYFDFTLFTLFNKIEQIKWFLNWEIRWYFTNLADEFIKDL